jgi:ferrochelatase
MKNDGINSMVIVPLYPHFSISTSGSSIRLLQEIFLKEPETWGPDKMKHTVVPAWYYREGYIKTMSNLIKNELSQYSNEERAQGLHILFSAHGVPQSYINAGDPYQRQIEECIRLIAADINKDPKYATYSFGENPIKIHLSFQSKVGPVQWLQPYTDDKIKNLGDSGVKNLVVVPVSFVSEHIETLEEIDMEYRELAEEHGIKHWRRGPALNTEGSFIVDMADMVMEALSSPTVTVTEATTQSLNDMTSDFDEVFKNKKSEVMNGRLAMLGITATAFAELVIGHPLIPVGFNH